VRLLGVTRVTVSRILNELAGGTAEEEVMMEYELTREDIHEALSAEVFRKRIPGSRRSRVGPA
jgi:uncharacterized protein (DUF433 family)